MKILCAGFILLWFTACGGGSRPAPAASAAAATETTWRRVGSWSGRGNQQLETFPVEGWMWRVQWSARNETPRGAGTLRVAALSADSGREIAEITDVRGEDHDTKYLSDPPRRYYLVVTSSAVDWSLVVEEPVPQ